MARHNKLRDGVAYLASKAFIPTNVRDDPKIYTRKYVTREVYNWQTLGQIM